MHHPLSITHREGMILGYLQIIHHFRPMHSSLPGNHPNTAIGSQNVHSHSGFPGWHKSVLRGEEGMLAGGMHHFTHEGDWFPMLRFLGGGRIYIKQNAVSMH